MLFHHKKWDKNNWNTFFTVCKLSKIGKILILQSPDPVYRKIPGHHPQIWYPWCAWTGNPLGTFSGHGFVSSRGIPVVTIFHVIIQSSGDRFWILEGNVLPVQVRIRLERCKRYVWEPRTATPGRNEVGSPEKMAAFAYSIIRFTVRGSAGIYHVIKSIIGSFRANGGQISGNLREMALRLLPVRCLIQMPKWHYGMVQRDVPGCSGNGANARCYDSSRLPDNGKNCWYTWRRSSMSVWR